MKGKDLFEALCKEIGAHPAEVGKIELIVQSNGMLWITGRAGKDAGRYVDWALWGSGDWKKSVKSISEKVKYKEPKL